jgi:hypothetical protein
MSKYSWEDPDNAQRWNDLFDGLLLGEPLTLRPPIVIKNPAFTGLMNRLYNGEAENVRESEL